ncbi:MAG: SDR family oxidoreductase [Balneolaceae bacterium]
MPYTTATAVITGASRGIGRKIALAFSRHTERPLFLIARSRIDLETVREECLEAGAPAVEIDTCDLTNPADVEALSIPEHLPAPALLVNNAGTFLLKKLNETSVQEFEEQWAINAKAPFLLTNKLLPRIRQNDRGLIVTISSVGALSGQARSGAYSSAKHAVLGWSRSLRKELAADNIAVTAINLGQTMSTSWKGVDVDPHELNDPEDVGRLIVALSNLSVRTVAEEITLRPIGGDRSPD